MSIIAALRDEIAETILPKYPNIHMPVNQQDENYINIGYRRTGHPIDIWITLNGCCLLLYSIISWFSCIGSFSSNSFSSNREYIIKKYDINCPNSLSKMFKDLDEVISELHAKHESCFPVKRAIKS